MLDAGQQEPPAACAGDRAIGALAFPGARHYEEAMHGAAWEHGVRLVASSSTTHRIGACMGLHGNIRSAQAPDLHPTCLIVPCMGLNGSAMSFMVLNADLPPLPHA